MLSFGFYPFTLFIIYRTHVLSHTDDNAAYPVFMRPAAVFVPFYTLYNIDRLCKIIDFLHTKGMLVKKYCVK